MFKLSNENSVPKSTGVPRNPEYDELEQEIINLVTGTIKSTELSTPYKATLVAQSQIHRKVPAKVQIRGKKVFFTRL
jgi:hypothetical protein